MSSVPRQRQERVMSAVSAAKRFSERKGEFHIFENLEQLLSVPKTPEPIVTDIVNLRKTRVKTKGLSLVI